MRIEKQESMKRFLEDVDEQIRYKPMHAAVNEELKNHIEDKAEVYMEYGVEEAEAYEKAVRDMGDASAIGIEMNRAHHLRVAWPLLTIILAMTAIGILGNIFRDRGAGNFDGILYAAGESLYFFWGMAVLAFVLAKGYPLILKYADWIERAYWMVCLGYILLRMFMRFFDIYFGSCFYGGIFGGLFSPSVNFGILQFSIPISVILLYRRRHRGFRGMLPAFLLQVLLMFFSLYAFNGMKDFVPQLTLLFAVFGTAFYMIGKKYMAVEKGKGAAAACAGLLLLLLLWAASQWGTVARNAQMFFAPETQITDAWDDAYNNVLIRELLGRAQLVGEIELTEEELIRYATAQWYFEDGEGTWVTDALPGEPGSLEEHVEYEMQFLEEPELRNVLPQHYHNNYRIAWWILKYGWLPGILLLLIPVTGIVLMFFTAFRIKNRLGRSMAFGCSLAFAVQTLFYMLGNFGFQFGMFGNFPFISEGLVSITGSALMAGLILSAYRFDTVTEEKDA